MLQVSRNDLPQGPNLDRSSGYASEDDTPTLKVEGGASWASDPNGDDVVQFQISDRPASFELSHIVWESPWLDSRSYVVRSGSNVIGLPGDTVAVGPTPGPARVLGARFVLAEAVRPVQVGHASGYRQAPSSS